MVRRISFRNTRKPPIGEVKVDEERKYHRQTADDLRRDLVEVSSTTPDMRDRVSFEAIGPGQSQTVAHGRPFKPTMFIVAGVQHEGEEAVSVWWTKAADSKNLYIRTTAPKGCKITLLLHP